MTGAVRLRVLDNHVVIGELLVAREVKPVQHALQTFAREFGADVITREFGAERERVNVHMARTTELAVERAVADTILVKLSEG